MTEKPKRIFRHESLQDTEALASHLSELAEAVREGTLHVSDENGALALEPGGLVRFELSGFEQDGSGALSVTLSWRRQEDSLDSSLKISRSVDGRPSSP